MLFRSIYTAYHTHKHTHKHTHPHSHPPTPPPTHARTHTHLQRQERLPCPQQLRKGLPYELGSFLKPVPLPNLCTITSDSRVSHTAAATTSAREANCVTAAGCATVATSHACHAAVAPAAADCATAAAAATAGCSAAIALSRRLASSVDALTA